MENMAVRRTERHDVALRGRFRIAESHAGIVRLAKASGVRDGAIETDVVDISGGGLGLLTPVFIPKRVHVRCQVLLPNSDQTAFECTGIVSRVVMTDRRPMYLIGLTFDEMSDAARGRLTALLVELGEIG
jgi:c-di-GMP-binding flagellar brake protein YcgR